MLRRLYWPINVALVVAVLTCPLAWYVSATSGYRSAHNRLNDSPSVQDRLNDSPSVQDRLNDSPSVQNRLKAEERCHLEIHKFVYTGGMTYLCRECGLKKRTSINNLLSRH